MKTWRRRHVGICIRVVYFKFKFYFDWIFPKLNSRKCKNLVIFKHISFWNGYFSRERQLTVTMGRTALTNHTLLSVLFRISITVFQKVLTYEALLRVLHSAHWTVTLMLLCSVPVDFFQIVPTRIWGSTQTSCQSDT